MKNEKKTHDTCELIKTNLLSFCNFYNYSPFTIEEIDLDTYVINWFDSVIDRLDFDEIDKVYHITQIVANTDDTLSIEISVDDTLYNTSLYEVPF